MKLKKVEKKQNSDAYPDVDKYQKNRHLIRKGIVVGAITLTIGSSLIGCGGGEPTHTQGVIAQPTPSVQTGSGSTGTSTSAANLTTSEARDQNWLGNPANDPKPIEDVNALGEPVVTKPLVKLMGKKRAPRKPVPPVQLGGKPRLPQHQIKGDMVMPKPPELKNSDKNDVPHLNDDSHPINNDDNPYKQDLEPVMTDGGMPFPSNTGVAPLPTPKPTFHRTMGRVAMPRPSKNEDK